MGNFKVVILVGGCGICIVEEMYIWFKFMVEIGGKLIFYYIMNIYVYYDF